MTVLFGIDRLLGEEDLRAPLQGKRVALVAHPASVTRDLYHSLDALIAAGVNITSAFGPQHGLKGDKQDNMIETADELDPAYGIPIYSLYGEVRRPSAAMMASADVFLFDLQDLGCRIYTFVTTLLYLLEAAAGTGKEVWVLDRPNPAGRPVEGMALRPGHESFVGAAPMVMRHGLTLGEMGHWFVRHFNLDVDYRVVTMEGWQPDAVPGSGMGGFGWPDQRIWINPSPNAANINMARAYGGTVMLEGTTLSEGRGTTRPLEVLFGAPDLDAAKVLAEMERLVRTNLPQARPPVVQRADDPCRRAILRPSRLSPVALAGAGLQGSAVAASRLSAVARLSLRICSRPAGDRRHQRRTGAARMGRRHGSPAGRSRCRDARGRGGLGRGFASQPALLTASSPHGAANTPPNG